MSHVPHLWTSPTSMNQSHIYEDWLTYWHAPCILCHTIWVVGHDSFVLCREGGEHISPIKSFSWYRMTQYQRVMSHIYELVIPIALSIRTPFPPPPWHHINESCPTSINQSYQSSHHFEHHFHLIQNTIWLSRLPPRVLSLEWVRDRKKVVSHMQTSHLMNRNTIWQRRVFGKRRMYECLSCYIFAPCLNFS